MQNFLELQCLVDDLVDFLELLMFINAYLIILFDEVDRKLGHKKIVRYHLNYFFKKLLWMT